MCTLTYIPTSEGSIITANRDENPARNAHTLSAYYSALGEEYLIAEEPLRGGTNVAVGQKSRTAILLNGAFERHDMNKTYGLSRGIVVLKSLDYKDLFSFANDFDFEKIEPFTLVNFGKTIREIRWDGKRIHRNTFEDDRPHIWSSAQLYLPEVRAKREAWFKKFLATEPRTAASVAKFHFNAGDGDPSGNLRMNYKGLVQTVSITQVADLSKRRKVKHWDLVENAEFDYSFEQA